MENSSKDSKFIKSFFSSSSLRSPKTEADGKPDLKIVALPIDPDGNAQNTKQSPWPPIPLERKTEVKATSSTLSPLAANVLRDARRQLSKEHEGQRGQSSHTTSQTPSHSEAPSERTIIAAVDKVLASQADKLSDVERADVIVHLQKDLGGWGILQPLVDDPGVTDIHVYDHRTVVLQRGKISEQTDLQWPSPQAYLAFVDRLLLRLGKALSTVQHTVDAAFTDGIRISAIHESVCVSRGPFLSIRIPRLSQMSLDSLVQLEVAPPLIAQYLGSLTRSGKVTMIVAGETGTGKTTLLKCLGSQFGASESIVTVEDTPELNFQHPFLRALVSRPANVEGTGEVTLQEHIKSTLRMTPTRVILGEMRTPLAAEAFLESAQTGHTGMSTIHARNAKETLVRLESLLGRAQKSVSIDILRQQIALAVDLIVWMFREKGSGKPRIAEIIEVGHYVEGVIQVRPMFRYLRDDLGQSASSSPTWRADSWTSFYDDILSRDGIYLGSNDDLLRIALAPPAPQPEWSDTKVN